MPRVLALSFILGSCLGGFARGAESDPIGQPVPAQLDPSERFFPERETIETSEESMTERIDLESPPLHEWTSEELDAKAQVVCTGSVTCVVVGNEKFNQRGKGNESFPMRTVIATIKVSKCTKGNVGPQIKFRYPNLDVDAVRAGNIDLISAPMQFNLSVGKRYRFYLNPSRRTAQYVSALAGDVDDGLTVQDLTENESTSRPPLLQGEATRLATTYLLHRRPSFKIDSKWIFVHFEGVGGLPPRWFVQFDDKGSPKFPFTHDAEIVVDEDRSIDPDSWIAVDPPPADRAKLAGKLVLIDYIPAGGDTAKVVRGRVETVLPDQLVIRLSRNDTHSQSLGSESTATRALKKVTIPTAEIKGLALLEE
jgi:hypothetical protein